MAGKIKGITIEFDGDTTKLGNALKKVNEQAKGIDKDLRAVNKSLKFNPKNAELLAQKQTLLRQKIKQSEDQLKAFKAAEKQMTADGVDKNSQEFMELRRNIIETESKLKHFNSELEKTKRAKFDQLGQSFKNVGSKMQTVGKGMTKYVTGPIVGVGAASIKAFDEVKNGLNIVTQKTGATGDELAKMQESARNLAKSIPTDFESAGTAIGEVNTRFGVTGDTLEKLSGQYIKFAKVNGVDLNNAIDTTQKALSAFGLSAEQAPQMLDALTRAGQQSGASVDTLAQGLVQNAAAFQQLGLGMDESVGLMAQLEKSGANSETVMQGLRKALKNAAADGIPLDKALSDLQNTIKNGKGDMDGLTAAYDLFGKSGDQIFNAVKNGSIDFSQLGAAASNSKGALDQVFQQTLTPSEQFQTSLNTMKDTGYTLGNSLMTILAPAIEKLSEGMQKISDWWQTLDPDTQDMIIKVGLVAAAIGPLLVILGKIATGIGSIISLLPMLASPAGIAIAAIAGIIAVGVVLYKNWDKIKKKAGELKDWISDKWNALKENTSKVFGRIKDAITHPIESAKNLIKKIVDKIKGFFNFHVELPKLKLPHFSIEPEGWKLSDLLHGVRPHLGIEWYANGGIFNSPSVIGVGEAGAEAVLPIDKLNTMLMGMADNIVNGIVAAQNMNGGGQDIVIPVYLYPSGAKMGETVVKTYDTYKRRLG